MYISITELLELYKPNLDHFSFCVFGARGTYKTTHLMGIYEELKRKKYNVVFGYDVEDIQICDCLILDDFATKFYKRDFSSTENKEFAKILQEIRTNIPLVITSCPDYSLLDKDFRDFFEPAPIVKNGFINLGGRILKVNPPSEKVEKILRSKELQGRTDRFLQGIERIKQAREKKKK
ncbi:hypothetical protein J2127_000555 [Methanococcus voltae]|uniref:hypothetical protein n=1 Tax=Methanococcus voltae TaxID=2188 RepID=UPI001AEB9CBA|nr:hypothetical protein [Methanococcus voltae]MBP2143400.1 hypothetical protein [Methanococcus voltae]